MGSVLSARPPQTLYVSIRRDELRQLQEERLQLQAQVEHLRQCLQQAQIASAAQMPGLPMQ